ncbi:Hsp20/alpha crystallin family protein [Thermodesulforhabdus norvegica]|uniref:Molecular chaperone IbpA, HSP20 family n=1 Tax=Thermodesulforhabdus norvegica TaxID=39841 RepID=A0A1I4T7K0_9BACT|nr:Hsp20/alpha crystallin family protein [Thermodesulforhabdus norvegica]SFM72547.1 Molecular chaperone IbpA, HSP20 family [Thermodesulforhabdus norvegica]
MTSREMQVREKQEVKGQAESTRDVPVYIPNVDIYETSDALIVLADMPGVAPENVDIDVRDDTLTIRGTVDMPGKDENPVLVEYEVGDYYRQFTLGRAIDQSRIEASMKDGVLKLVLPKVDVAKPRKIEVKAG